MSATVEKTEAFVRLPSPVWRAGTGWLRAVLLGVAAWPLAFAARGEPDGAIGAKPNPIEGNVISFVDDANLGHRRMFDIDFERNGTAWIAASDGLYRYDGYRWQRFSVEQGLPSVFVRSVLVTRDQTLWVGTDKGAGIFDGNTFKLLGTDKTLAGTSVRRMVEDPDGTIWFCSDSWPDATVPGGLTSFREGRWKRYGPSDGLEPTHVLNYFRDSAGRQFVTGKGAFPIYQKKGERWAASLKGATSVWAMAESPGFGVVAALADALCFRSQGRWEAVKCFVGENHFVLSTRGGEILAGGGASNGLVVRKWMGAAFEQVSPLIATASDRFGALREAPDGAIWGTGDGLLVRWDRGGGEWRQYQHLPPPRFLDHDGRIWFIGPQYSWMGEGEKLTKVESVASDAVPDRRGGVWCWTDGEISYWFNGALQVFDHTSSGLSQVEGCVPDPVSGVWFYGRDAQGRLVSARFDGSEWRQFEFPAHDGKQLVAAATDPRRGAWFLFSQNTPQLILIQLTDEGMVTHELQYGGARYYPTQMMVDPAGGIWIYGGSGLYYSPPGRPDEWQRIQNVGANHILTGCPARGESWFVFDGLAGGQNGFGVVQKTGWKQRQADVTGFATAGDDGTLFFGGPGYVSVVHHSDLHDVSRLSLPVPGEVQSLIQTRGAIWVEIKSPNGAMSVWRYRSDGIPPATIVKLGSTEISVNSKLKADVAGVERFQPLRSGRRFRFSWRFDDGAWSGFGDWPADGVSVEGLESGSHRLEVRAQDESLQIDPHPAVTSFVVTPVPLQYRPWFGFAVFATIGIVAALAIVAAERARKYASANATLRQAQDELQRAHGELQRRVEERRRLGRELHDSLAQGLASTSIHLEAAVMSRAKPESAKRHINTARRLLEHTQTEVRRSMHDLRATASEMRTLTKVFKDYAVQIRKDTSVKVLVETSGEEQRLPPEVGHNLFRIGQEAITNALKHAKARKIRVRIDFGSDKLHLTVTDDGQGFQAPNGSVPNEHFGLVGMRERAERMGGNLQIESTGIGTSVIAELKIQELSKYIE